MKKWFILLLLLSPLSFAQELITKTISLNYIQPAAVIKALKPMLQQGESISSLNNNLIINVTKDTLTRIRPLIHQLDVAPVTFLIAVHQGDANWLDTEQDDVSYSATSGASRADNQNVQVTSGSYALVSTGSDTPVISQVNAGWVAGVGYDRMKSQKGFLIRPELKGNKVSIHLKRMYTEPNPVNNQVQNQQEMSTSTIVPLDQWVKLAQMSGPDSNNSEDDSVSYGAGGGNEYKGTLYIKVSISKN